MGLRPTVHVTHGSNSEWLALSGDSVADAVGLITGELGWSVGNLDWTVNGERAGDLPDGEDTILMDDDELSFMARAGNKGSEGDIDRMVAAARHYFSNRG